MLITNCKKNQLNQTSNLQKTTHTLSLRESYEVSIMRILNKIDRVITAPHRTAFGHLLNMGIY